MNQTLLDPAAHSVQFYRQDSFLLESTTWFLGSALGKGKAAMVVATGEHRREIAARLRGLGIDLDRAREAGRYIEFDAEELLLTIMPEGRLDGALFSATVGDAIAKANAAAGGAHQCVAVFGEAVSLLCARGQFESAIKLEQLWNDLARAKFFTLLCGYAAGSFGDAAHADAFSKICAEHGHVFPEEGYLELEDGEERLRYIAQLQQKARALEAEMAARRRSEEALARSEKLAAVGRLTASIAHEINNPLMSLTNLFYLINMDTSLDPAARHYVALADQELRRTARITKQMLAFHRESVKRVPCKLSPIVDGVLELYEARLRKSNIILEKHYEVEGAIEGFPAEMRQLFANLIGNAIEAVGANGRIRLRISAARDWSDSSRLGVRISIGDTGPGISTEDQARIFEPFFTTKGESGTGLGLWVSRGIVQKHEGRIRFRSRLRHNQGGGTVFSIFLPSTAQHLDVVPAADESDRPEALGATG